MFFTSWWYAAGCCNKGRWVYRDRRDRRRHDFGSYVSDMIVVDAETGCLAVVENQKRICVFTANPFSTWSSSSGSDSPLHGDVEHLVLDSHNCGEACSRVVLVPGHAPAIIHSGRLPDLRVRGWCLIRIPNGSGVLSWWAFFFYPSRVYAN